MDYPKSRHKKSRGTLSMSQSTTPGSTDNLNKYSFEDVKSILPKLKVVTPEVLLKESFGEAACDPVPDGDKEALKMLLPLVNGKRVESDMYPELVSIHNCAYSHVKLAYPPQMDLLRLRSVQAKHAFRFIHVDIEMTNILVSTPENTRSPESSNGRPGTYFVISSPFSRSTRVYLAIHKDDFEAKIFHRTIYRTPKLSWQSVLRHLEYDFYQEPKLSNTAFAIKHLAHAITGGRVKSNIQKNERFIGCARRIAGSRAQASFTLPLRIKSVIGGSNTEPGETLQEHFNGIHEPHIVLENVGKPLRAFADIREPIRELGDALEADHSLARLGLQRDISENNVNDQGLLIDPDMAKDLKDASKFGSSIARIFPIRTNSGVSSTLKGAVTKATFSEGKNGAVSEKLRAQVWVKQGPKDDEMNLNRARDPIRANLHYLSISFRDSPVRKEWHDLESVFWLLVWMTIRHLGHGSLTFGSYALDLSSPKERRQALKEVFGSANPELGDVSIRQISANKRGFLDSGRIILPDYSYLQFLISNLQTRFGDLHKFLGLAHRARHALSDFGKRIEVNSLPEDLVRPSSAGNMEELRAYVDRCIANRCLLMHVYERLPETDRKHLGDYPKEIDSSIKWLESQLDYFKFPDHALVCGEFDKAIRRRENSTNQLVSFDYQKFFPPVYVPKPRLNTILQPKSSSGAPSSAPTRKREYAHEKEDQMTRAQHETSTSKRLKWSGRGLA